MTQVKDHKLADKCHQKNFRCNSVKLKVGTKLIGFTQVGCTKIQSIK